MSLIPKLIYVLTISIVLFLASMFDAYGQVHKKEFFVFLNSNPNREILDKDKQIELQTAHIANIDSLYSAGDIIATGPFEGGGGVFIILATNRDEVMTLIKTDPAIRANRFILEVFPMEIFSGSICENINSTEMAKYIFVRMHKDMNNHMNQHDYDKLNDIHPEYLLNIEYPDSVMLGSYFDDGEGGIIIFNLNSEEKVDKIMQLDPMVRSGFYNFKLRTLLIAEGTFCKGGN